MKTHLTIALCASVIAITACTSENLKVGSREDIIVKNRGDVSTIAMTETTAAPMPEAALMPAIEPAAEMAASDVMPAETAPLQTPEEMMETAEAAAADVTDSIPVSPAIPAAPIGAPVTAAATGETIVPVTTPSIASGDIVVEVPEAVVQTSAGAVESVANVVTEHQGVDKYPPKQPIVTENQQFDTAAEALEEIVEDTARVSPYVPSY